jgi:hypothetical protein
VNEKTIDQIEEVLICEISDEAVEAAGRAEIAGVWTFVCNGGIQCHQVFSRRKWKSPGRGDRGFKDGRGWGVGGPSIQPKI